MNRKSVISRWIRSSTSDADVGESSSDTAIPITRRIFNRTMLIGLPATIAAALMTQKPEIAEAGVDGDWTLGGNTLAGGQFLGSTNAAALNIRTSNLTRMTITAAGNVGIGTVAPPARLGVVQASGVSVFGSCSNGTGVYGASNTGIGVRGNSAATTSNATAVVGQITSTTPGGSSAGVRGINNGTGGLGIGVYGSQAGSGWGVYGTTPKGLGVYGATSSGTGVYGTSGTGKGVSGSTSSTAGGAIAVQGEIQSSTPGSYSTGVRGINNGTGGLGIGVYGSQAGSGWGVFGTAPGGLGVYGSSSSGTGTYGSSSSGTGVYGSSSSGVGIRGTTGSTASSAAAILGEVQSTAPGGYSAGVRGINNGTGGLGIGVYGSQAGRGWGVYGTAPSGVGVYGATSSGYAGYFSGRVHVNGTLSKSAGSFRIDHPLAPDTRYLSHSFVESPDMLNIYNGNATLDANGTAQVEMPAWFEALNQEFRYQLTAIGAAAPNLHIAAKIKNNRFKIAGGVAGMEVSWQVTGIRHDAYANAHRIPVEEDKPADERGTYLNPVEHGQPADKATDHASRKAQESDQNNRPAELPALQKMPPELENRKPDLPTQVP